MFQTMACPFCTKEFQIAPKRHYEQIQGFRFEVSRTLCGKEPETTGKRSSNLIAKDGEIVNCKICIRKKSEIDKVKRA